MSEKLKDALRVYNEGLAEKKPLKFDKETDLCKAFIDDIPEGWTAYPETGGFDILLVRKCDGFQIGVEAKLKLNTKVICQVAEPIHSWYQNYPGPDCRAVLIPEYSGTELSEICAFLGITVIKQRVPGEKYRSYYTSGRNFWPDLPSLDEDYYSNQQWHEFAPMDRLTVPDWVPDVIAGDKSPVTLSHWKICAIKISVILEKRGHVTRQDFQDLKLSMSRWTQGSWLSKGAGKTWIKGIGFPNFRAQHPKNYAEIEADYEKWRIPGRDNDSPVTLL